MNEKLERCIKKVLQFFSAEIAEKYAAALVQFIKFGLVGLSNTLIAYILNVLVLLALRNADVQWDYIAGNTISFVLSVLWSFFWNNKYVFTQNKGTTRVWWKTLLKTYVCYGFTGIILSNVMSWMWITKFGVSKYISPLINLIISVPLNFVLNKKWAYKAVDT